MEKQDARWFGSMWHLVWATVYTPPGKDGFVRTITKPEEIHQLWDDLTKNTYTTISCDKYFGEDDEKEFYDAVKLGHFMIDGQLRQWNLDPQFEVIMPEQRFRANVPFNTRQQKQPLNHWTRLGYSRGANSGGYIALLVGTFDMPVFDHASGKPIPKILDWKTTNKRNNAKQMNKDNQTGTYMAISTMVLRSMGLIQKDQSCEEMIFSYARKALPPDPEKVDDQGRIRNQPTIKDLQNALLCHNFDEDELKGLKKEQLDVLARTAGLKVYGEISKNQGAPLFWREVVRRNKANRLRQISRIADDAEAMAAVRAGVSPVLKAPGEHCNWCDFSDLCDIDEDGGDVADFKKQMFKFEDPYKDHQEGAENSKNESGG